jgi:hypothetical protein
MYIFNRKKFGNIESLKINKIDKMAKIKYFKFEDAEKVFNIFKGLSISAKL